MKVCTAASYQICFLIRLIHWFMVIYLIFILFTNERLHLWEHEEIFSWRNWIMTRHDPSSFKMPPVIILPLLLCGSGDICGYCCYSLWHMGTKSMCISILWAGEEEESLWWRRAARFTAILKNKTTSNRKCKKLLYKFNFYITFDWVSIKFQFQVSLF